MNEAIELYYYHDKMIDELFSDIALEAIEANDTDVNKSDPNTGTNTLKNFADKVSEQAERIYEMLKSMVQRCIDKVMSIINEALVTHKGFVKEMDRCIKAYKPKDTITIVNYNYNPSYIDGFTDKFTNEFNKVESEFKNGPDNLPENSLLNMDKEQLNEHFKKLLNLPSSIEELNSAYSFIKTKFRGNKTEQTLNNSDRTKAIEVVRGYTKYQDKLNTDMEKCKKITNTIKFQLRSQRIKNNKDVATRKKMNQMLRNISSMFNIYTTFVRSLYNLRMEYYFNNRVIVKKFYNMKI